MVNELRNGDWASSPAPSVEWSQAELQACVSNETTPIGLHCSYRTKSELQAELLIRGQKVPTEQQKVV